jgi:hypothetical protein
MPIYDCGDPECTECEEAFGPSRGKAIAEFREKSRRWTKHTHVAGTTHGRDIDECAFCGLDIRNAIHAGM